MSLTYTSYLKVHDLINMQEMRSNPEEHDETLFIIIHQAYELWFKQILHEIDYLKNLFVENDIAKAIKTIGRILKILKVQVHQVDILETMTPLEFLSFRDYLDTASGFQSFQFREVEFVLGYKNKKFLKFFDYDEKIKSKLEKRLNEPTLWDYFIKYLNNNSYPVPNELLNRDITESNSANKDIQTILIDIYKNNPIISILCERLTDLDEGLQEWRYRHVKMVERTIGVKMGTGGSAGAEYLKNTLFKPVFPDLWAIRSEFTQ